MPEKEKNSVCKSSSLQEICRENSNNIFERQVDSEGESTNGICYHQNTGEEHDKVKSLPAGSKSNGFYFMGRTNKLKRPILHQKLSLANLKRKVRSEMSSTSNGDNNDVIQEDTSKNMEIHDLGTVTSSSSSTTKSFKKMVKTDSVKNFFVKVVNQISVNSRTRAKDLLETEERSREWRSYFDNHQGSVPGVIGIRNHGNTCFINSILQCLSYTDILAEYFVLDQYKNDLRRRRRISAFTRAHGTGRGELTEQFATLLKSLWSLQYVPEISDKFKSLVDKYGSQYKVVYFIN